MPTPTRTQKVGAVSAAVALVVGIGLGHASFSSNDNTVHATAPSSGLVKCNGGNLTTFKTNAANTIGTWVCTPSPTTTSSTTSTTAPPTSSTASTVIPTTTTTTPTSAACSKDGSQAMRDCVDRSTGVGAEVPGGISTADAIAGKDSKLTHTVSGNMTITTPGTTVADTTVLGCIAVRADNVTIKNVLVYTQNMCQGGTVNGQPGSAGGSSAISTGAPVRAGAASVHGLKLQDVTVTSGGSSPNQDAYGLFLSYATVDHLNTQGWSKGFSALNSVAVTNSYFGPVTTKLGTACANHISDTFVDWSASDVSLNSSWFVVGSAATDFCTGGGVSGAIIFPGDPGPATRLTVSNNYIEADGGGGDINGCTISVNGKIPCTFESIVNNVLSTKTGFGVPVVNFNPTFTGNQFSGNTTETGTPVTIP